MSLLERLRARAGATEAARQAEADRAARLAAGAAAFRPGSAALAEPQPEPGRLGVKLLLARERDDPEQWSDIRRIISLPIAYGLEPEEVEEFCRANVLGAAFEAGFRLWPQQCQAVMEYDTLGGVFCTIGVGWGKTLITLMIAARAFKKSHVKGRRSNQRILLVTTPSVYEQLVDHDIGWARTKVPLGLPFYPLGGKSLAERARLARSSRKGCYIIPNSLLSAKDASDLLDHLKPDTVILDEGHNFSNSSAARTKRLFALKAGSSGYITANDPEVIVLSGTMTKKSIRDYHHFLKAALGDKMPLPVSSQMAAEWSNVLDADAGEPSSAATGPIKPMVEWARRNFPMDDFPFDTSGIRRAYKTRLTSSPGVVATGDAEIGTSLVLSNAEVPLPDDYPGAAELKRLTDDLNNLWVTPNGDEIEHQIHTYKWAYELSAGFYNQLTWPTAEKLAERQAITAAEAESALMRAKEHHEAHQEYSKALREWLADFGRHGIDTPMLVGQSMFRDGAKVVGSGLFDLWTRMKDLAWKGMPERDSSAVRVCDYKVARAVEWAKTVPAGHGALLWVYNREIGSWLYEMLRAAGADALHCPAGSESNTVILDPANANKIIVASIKAHGVGKNLQAFQYQHVVQWPRSAVDAEQMLGRCHRNGQMADELIVSLCNSNDFDHANFAATMNDAVYIHTTTDNWQKLVYCGYRPQPRIFPHAVLHERGMQPKILSREQRRVLEEKFTVSPVT